MSILLPLLLNCNTVSGGEADHSSGYIIAGSMDQNNGHDSTDFDYPCITFARTAGFTSEENTFQASVRTFKTGRRIQPSVKYSERIIKAGKVIDRRYFHAFQTKLLQFQSGTHSTQRYIHTICSLLI